MRKTTPGHRASCWLLLSAAVCAITTTNASGQVTGVAKLDVFGPTFGDPTPPPDNVIISGATVGFNFTVPFFGGGDIDIELDGAALLPTEGVLLATVRENLRANRHGIVEVPGPLTHLGGSLTNGGFWLASGSAGIGGAGVSSEMNINLAAAYFPFSAGWIGGVVDEDGTLLAGSPDLTQTNVTKTGTGRYDITLPWDSRDFGMLYVIGASNADHPVTAGVLADGSGWRVAVRDNIHNVADGLDDEFRFVFVPYQTINLVGGRIDLDGTVIQSEGGFTMTRESLGTYRLSVPNHSPDTGVLILTTSEMDAAGLHPEDNILSYQPAGDDFIIQSKDLPNPTVLEDSQFVFSFIPFADPLEFQVPEPGTLTVVCTVIGLCGTRRLTRRTSRTHPA